MDFPGGFAVSLVSGCPPLPPDAFAAPFAISLMAAHATISSLIAVCATMSFRGAGRLPALTLKMGSFGKTACFIQPRAETSTESGAGIASPRRIRCTRSSCAIPVHLPFQLCRITQDLIEHRSRRQHRRRLPSFLLVFLRSTTTLRCSGDDLFLRRGLSCGDKPIPQSRGKRIMLPGPQATLADTEGATAVF
jgi:hypothetical protein